MQVQEYAFRGPRVVRFLRHLLHHIPGTLLVIWDGVPIHRSRVVKEFLAHGGAEQLWLEQLPSYAPELNPVEGIWRHLKHVHLRNVCCLLEHSQRSQGKREKASPTRCGSTFALISAFATSRSYSPPAA